MYGPPFARLEKQTTTQIWTSDEQWTRTDNYIIFYTDKTYTKTEKLPYPRRIRIQVENGELVAPNTPHNFTSFIDITIPAGSFGQHVGTTERRSSYDYGNLVRYHCEDYFIVPTIEFNEN